MSSEENAKQIPAPRNADWQIMPGPDGKFPDAQVTHSLLKDIRESANSIRKIMVFFAVLVIVECAAVLAIWLLLHA
jgi:hypothetical protein